MKFLQINFDRFDGLDSIQLEDYLESRPAANYLLLDCRQVTQSQLLELLEAVRTCYIIYAYPNQEQSDALQALGDFDVTKIWEDADFIEHLTFMFDDLLQTQGFSALPDEAARLRDDFPGRIERRGRYEMLVEGDFPEETVLLDFQRLVKNWGRTVFVMPFRRFYNAPGRHRLTFDYATTGDLQVIYVIYTLDRAGNLIKTDRIIDKEYRFDAPKNAEYRGQILLKGSGSVRLGKVWTYKDKLNLGWFQAGDQRTETEAGELIHSLYLPGKRHGKLIVGFSGNLSELPHYERQSMANYGFPVLLFCDLRGRGGAFHIGKIGDHQYENAVMKRIDDLLISLNLTRSDLIMAGWSMGSFPAVYYGMKMQAGDVIAAKPLLHIGSITQKVEVAFKTEPSMISAREYLTGFYRPEDTEQLDQIIENCLRASDLTKTNFYSFIMKNDELDHCESFFRNIKNSAKSVACVEEAGFHPEKIPEMSRWIDQILSNLTKSL
ncbi:MAG: hypothetical protein LBV19_01345 [Streptococcaceae bacterium]|jgi:accessory secretory protein Asp2|nr:hypothetical protein [Streptococcaceae bacterium]